MNKKTCAGCDKEVESYVNWCSWDCNVDAARRAGGMVICPNGLPIRCIRFDNAMLEHEHADHPDYKFPITIQYIGVRDELPEWDSSYADESHALIYVDGSIALTLYECTYTVFSLDSGQNISGSYRKCSEWKIDQESLDRVRALRNVTPA